MKRHLDCRDKICLSLLNGYFVSCGFESFTGADIILTPNDTERITVDNIQTHLDAGAVMLQVKHNMDISASTIDGRVFEALERMVAWDCQPYQRGLLITGDITFNAGDPTLHINNRRASITKGGLYGVMNTWVIRGGAIYGPIIPTNDLEYYLDLLSKELFTGDPFVHRQYSQPRKKFKIQRKTTQGMSLRQRALAMAETAVDSYDLRHLLVNIDGLNSTVVERIWNKMSEEKLPMTIVGFNTLVLTGKILDVKGVGKSTLGKIRRQLGYERSN